MVIIKKIKMINLRKLDRLIRRILNMYQHITKNHPMFMQNQCEIKKEMIIETEALIINIKKELNTVLMRLT